MGRMGSGVHIYSRGECQLDVTPPHPTHGCHVLLGGHTIHKSTAHVQTSALLIALVAIDHVGDYSSAIILDK